MRKSQLLAGWMTFSRLGRQTASVTYVGIATLPQRLGSASVVVMSIAGVVAVLPRREPLAVDLLAKYGIAQLEKLRSPDRSASTSSTESSLRSSSQYQGDAIVAVTKGGIVA